MAAVLACEPGALLSHTSAAWLWGLVPQGPTAVHVTAPTRRHRRLPIHLHFAALVDEDRDEREGIPVTAVPRTLLDLAARLPAHRLGRCVERADELRLLDTVAVEVLLARLKGHRGRGRLRRTLATYRPELALTRSELERRFLDLVRQGGLPIPSTNVFVAGCEVDAYWPEERFVVELDGFEFHRSRASFERDRRRQEDLKLDGIEMIRVTARRLEAEPLELVERLEALLAQRRRNLE